MGIIQANAEEGQIIMNNFYQVRTIYKTLQGWYAAMLFSEHIDFSVSEQ